MTVYGLEILYNERGSGIATSSTWLIIWKISDSIHTISIAAANFPPDDIGTWSGVGF